MNTKEILFQKTVHFIGIGGAGMIALAQYLRAFGQCKVTGSDIKMSPALEELALHGCDIHISHDEAHVKQADFVVFSTAISEDNPELSYARTHKKDCFRRSEFLALLMKDYKQIISVSGTHGKTTTTGLAIHILDSAGIIPSFMIGGELTPYYMNGRYSESSTFVTESDESDASFLNLVGHLGLITNIDLEHMNFYETEENLMQHFERYIQATLEKKGFLSMNQDDPRSRHFIQQLNSESYYTVSLKEPSADLFADAIQYSATGTRFHVIFQGKDLGEVSLNLFGEHNVYNALSIIALMLKMNIPFSHIQKGCQSFKGVKRRMQHVGSINGASIYDDYGHHPTEVATTLAGIRSVFDGNITCIFQPHRISRLQHLLDDFKAAFSSADNVIITPIYTANEAGDAQSLANELVAGIKKESGATVTYLDSYAKISEQLMPTLSAGDIVITMGAGDIFKFAHELAKEKPCFV